MKVQKDVPVKPHTRGGKAVAGHIRRIAGNPNPSRRFSLKRSPLESLDATGPPVLPRQPNFDEWANKINVMHRDLEDYLWSKVDAPFDEEIDNFGKIIVASSATMLAGLGAGAVGSIFFPPLIPPLVIGGLLAGTGILAKPIATHAIKTQMAKWRFRRKAHKMFEEGHSAITRKALREITSHFPWTPSSPLAKKSFKEKAFNFLKKITPPILRSRKKAHVATSVMPGGAVAISWSGRADSVFGAYTDSDINPNGVTYFYPGADLSKDKILFHCDLRGANLAAINFQTTRMWDVNLDGANLAKANFRDADMIGTMRDANLEGADLRDVNLSKADLQGANLEDANLTGAFLQQDLTGVDITAGQFNSLTRANDGSGYYKYEQISFHDAVNELGISEQRFEFLVLSGVVKVRDNETQELVQSGFDPERHHIGPWCMKAARQVLAEGTSIVD